MAKKVIRTLEDLKNLSSDELEKLNLSIEKIDEMIDDVNLKTEDVEILLEEFKIKKELYEENKELYVNIEELKKLVNEICMDSDLDFQGIYRELHNSQLNEEIIERIIEFEHMKMVDILDQVGYYPIFDEIICKVKN